jgi:membrane protein implicated in regulation of membrane protease activity
MADEGLSSSQMFLLISGLVALSCALEILVVWWENKHKPEIDIGSPFEMVGRHGVVEKECSPEGTVIIGNEIWSAISFNQQSLKPGIDVTIKERQGLKLYVEKAS